MNLCFEAFSLLTLTLILFLTSLTQAIPAIIKDSVIDISLSPFDTTPAPKLLPRVPKTAKTTTTSSTTTTTIKPSTTAPKKIATHPPWPSDVTTSKPRATHAPWPGKEDIPDYLSGHFKISGKHGIRATHTPYPYRDNYYSHLENSEHLYPTRSTYAPYVYGSSSSQKAKRKSVISSIIDKEVVNNYVKDIFAYLFAPFMVPGAVSNAITTPAGLEAETFWGRFSRNLRAAFLKRSSEERHGGEGQASANANNVLVKLLTNTIANSQQLMKERFIPATSMVAEAVVKKIKAMTKSEDEEEEKGVKHHKDVDGSEDKKKKSVDGGRKGIFQPVQTLSRFVDFFRMRKPRTNVTNVSRRDKAIVEDTNKEEIVSSSTSLKETPSSSGSSSGGKIDI